MKFLRDMLSRKADHGAAKFGRHRSNLNPKDSAEAAIEALKRKGGVPIQEHKKWSPKLSDIVGAGVEKLPSETQLPSETHSSDEKPTSAVSMNIWDMDDDATAAPMQVAPTQVAPAQVVSAQDGGDTGLRRRQNRTKTRVLSFEPTDDTLTELFNTANAGTTESEGQKSAVAMFPTGWLVVIDGPGRGASFPLNQGLSQIGRGSDQTVCLDFGDSAISRTYHAAIAYDTASNKFHVGHGGKSNIVRLNKRPLLSTEMIADGDTLQIGETILVLKVLCNETFNWGKSKPEGETDAVALT
jgi:hypothetical protein